jgi:mlo protein
MEIFRANKHLKFEFEDSLICSRSVTGLQALFWASIIPVIVRNLFPVTKFPDQRKYHCSDHLLLQIILAVGTKLQAILTMMALEITDRHAVVQGMPLVQASDKYFWFGRPQLLLHLIHFALFQVQYGRLCKY